MRIFADTGAWIAIADRNDQYAKVASQFYTDLILQRSNLLTSNLVLVETFNLLSRTIGGIRPLSNLAMPSKPMPSSP